MATVKLAYATDVTMTVTNLHSLANSATAGWQSAAVDNSTNLYLDALVQVTCVLATGTPASDQAIYIYAYGSGDGSSYTDNATGTQGTLTRRDPTNMRLIGVISTPTSGGLTYKSHLMSIASAFGGILPPSWGIYINNFSGLALAASGNAVHYRPISSQITSAAAVIPPTPPAPGIYTAIGPATAPLYTSEMAAMALPPDTTGYTVTVLANPLTGAALQSAINAAAPGTILKIPPQTIALTGPITLADKTNPAGDWIIIQPTDTAMAALPAYGTRVAPADATNMVKFTSPGSNYSIFQTTPGSGAGNYYRIVGIEGCPVNAAASIGNLIGFGSGVASDQTTLGSIPHHLVIDRCYLHGAGTTSEIHRAVDIHCSYGAVLNSYICDIKNSNVDCQAIFGANGPGPYLIENNYLEASCENIMFGGSDPGLTNLIPSDIVIRLNHIDKPTSYEGTIYSIKNLLELKNARRLWIEGNLIEHVWSANQAGHACPWGSVNQQGTAPWCGVTDITFTNNVLRHAGSAFSANISLGPAVAPARYSIINNLFYDLSTSWDLLAAGGLGRVINIIQDCADFTFDHNTCIHDGYLVGAVANLGSCPRFVWTNTIAYYGLYGVFHSDDTVDGTALLNAYMPGWTWDRNVMVGSGGAGVYPAAPATNWPANTAAVGFVNAATGDYRLTTGSAYHLAGTDGKDIGCDFAALAAAMGSLYDLPG